MVLSPALEAQALDRSTPLSASRPSPRAPISVDGGKNLPIGPLHRFAGAGTNTTFSVGFIQEIEFTIAPDNTISGTIDSDGLPGGTTICGAGDLSGTISGNTVDFSYTSFDPDSGCGFEHGLEVLYTGTLSEDGSVLSGSYLFGNGQEGIYRVVSRQAWGDLEALRRDYNSKKNTNRAAFSHQFLCIASKSCEDSGTRGDTGWANGFVKHLFHEMSLGGLPQSLEVECHPIFSNEHCFAEAGQTHGYDELLPGFMSYCKEIESEADYDRWDSEHESFLENAVKPCFDEVGNAGELSALEVAYRKSTVPILARTLRESVQVVCRQTNPVGGRLAARGALNLPDPPTRDDLFSEAIEGTGTLKVQAGAAFFLPVGSALQLQVTKTLPDSTVVDLTAAVQGTVYQLLAGSSHATIGVDGLLEVTGTDSPLTSMAPLLHVLATNGADWGVGQFAITDVDTDGDFLVDSVETELGLFPEIGVNQFTDLDSDTLIDLYEALLGTQPMMKDSDADLFDDGYEHTVGSHPTDPTCTPFAGCTHSNGSLGLIFFDGFESGTTANWSAEVD